MRLFKSLISVILVIMLLTSCRKKVDEMPIIDPTACMTLSTDSLRMKDSIIVYNCSQADDAYVFFTDSTNSDPPNCKCTLSGPVFDSINKVVHFFPYTGTHYVYLRASNRQNGSRIKSVIMKVIVLP